MKFPRNARVFRGQLDAAPFASVFFLLLIFVLLESLVPTPGLHITLQLPEASGNLPGASGPTLAVAVVTNGQLYFENQPIGEIDFSNRVASAVRKSSAPLTLVVQADKAVNTETLVRLETLARGAGVHELLLATLPGPFPAPAPTPARP